MNNASQGQDIDGRVRRSMLHRGRDIDGRVRRSILIDKSLLTNTIATINYVLRLVKVTQSKMMF